MSSSLFPTTELERSLGARYVIGIDEVGRGAVAGPVAVGAFVLDIETLATSAFPAKLQDSKLMTAKSRDSAFEELATWTPGFAVGMVDAKAIDAQGIIDSLSSAAVLALEQLREKVDLQQAHILLDGTHNWLSSVVSRIPVTVRAKADRDCASVSAAAVMAKVTRDRLMVELSETYPTYGFEKHKGYASPTHIAALKSDGPSEIHRVSWLTRILEA